MVKRGAVTPQLYCIIFQVINQSMKRIKVYGKTTEKSNKKGKTVTTKKTLEVSPIIKKILDKIKRK